MKYFSPLFRIRVIFFLVILLQIPCSFILESRVLFAFEKTPLPIESGLLLPEQYEHYKNGFSLFQEKKYNEATEAFYQFLATNPPPPLNQQAGFLMGMGYYNLGQWTSAQKAFRKSMLEYLELADYATFNYAECHRKLGNLTGAIAVYQELIDTFPESLWTEKATISIAETFSELKQYPKAIEIYNDYLRRHSNSSRSPSMMLMLGQSLEKNNQLSAAANLYKEIWLNYPSSREASKAFQRRKNILKITIKNIDPFNFSELFERGNRLLASRKYRDAIHQYKSLLNSVRRTALFSSRHYPLLLKIGICRYRLRENNRAIANFKEVASKSHISEEVDESLYWLGKVFLRQDNNQALAAYQKLLKHNPQSHWADEALYYIGWILKRQGDLALSHASFSRLVKEYPNSQNIYDARWHLGWISHQRGLYHEALQTWTDADVLLDNPYQWGKYRYWSARLLQKKGQPKEAAFLYRDMSTKTPFSYYGVMARHRLINKPLELYPPIDSYVTDTGQLDEESSMKMHKLLPSPSELPIALQKARELIIIGLHDDARKQLNHAADSVTNNDKTHLDISKLYLSMGDYFRSQREIHLYLEPHLSIAPNVSNITTWKLAFPRPYLSEVLKYTWEFSIDPNLVYAIMRTESTFRPDITSSANARGLMQIIPSTGKRLARQLGIRNFHRNKLYNPEINIRFACRYLHKLLDQFDNNGVLAIASYNAGEHKVERWLKQYTILEIDEFVEKIPYYETRQYVKKVLKNLAIYRILYGAHPDRSSSPSTVASNP